MKNNKYLFVTHFNNKRVEAKITATSVSKAFRKFCRLFKLGHLNRKIRKSGDEDIFDIEIFDNPQISFVSGGLIN